MFIFQLSAVNSKGGLNGGGLQTLFYIAKESKSGNIIKFFNEMVKGAKTAAASVDDSAGTIKKALAGISGGAKGAWNSIGLFGKIGIGVAAVTTAYSIISKLEQNAREDRQSSFDNAMSTASESSNVYDLYKAYEAANEAYDGSASSKEALETATRSLAEALGIEKDAIDGVKDSLHDATGEELEAAVDNAEQAVIAAKQKIAGNATGGSISFGTANNKGFIKQFAASLMADEEEDKYQYDINVTDSVEQAEHLVNVYNKMLERRKELVDSGKYDTREYKALDSAINYLKPDIDDLTSAQNLLIDSTKKYNDFLNPTSGDDVADAVTKRADDLKAASEKTIAAITDIQNAQSALASQEAGKSISPSDFTSDELKDYASALEYVNGVYKLNAEKVNAIVEAKANEQVAINDTNKALAQQKYLENAKQIAKYREELEAAKSSGDDSVDTIKSNIEALLKENSSLKAECDQYDLMSAALAEATGAYQNWINAKSASESGDMFDSTLEALKQIDDTLNNSDSDLFGRVGRTDYKAAVDFVIPDTIDKEDSDAVNSYLQSISDMFTYDSNGNKSGLNVWNFIDKSLQNGLLVEDGDVYRVAGEKSMKDFADGLGLALPLVRAMFGELEEFGAKFDWSDEAHKTFGDLVVAATDAADTLKEKLGDKYQLSIDVSDASKELDTVDKQVTYLDKTIADMQDAISKKETIDLDDSEVVAAQDVIRAAVAQKQLLTEPDIMKVDTSLVEGKLGEALTVLQRFQEAKNALKEAQKLNIGVDEAKAELESATQAVQDLDASVTSPKVLNIDTTSVDSIAESLQNLTAELIVKAGVDDKAILGYTPDTKSATVKYSVDRRAVDAFNPPNLTRYVTYHATMEGAADTNWHGSSKGSGGRGRVNGSANAYGSARVGSAKLQGDWRAHAGRSLVGELGLFLSSLTWRHV